MASGHVCQYCAASYQLYYTVNTMCAVTSWRSSSGCTQTLRLWSLCGWRFVRVWADLYRWPAACCVLTLHVYCGMSGVWAPACCMRATSTQAMRLSTQCAASAAMATESTRATSSMRLEPAAAASWSLVSALFSRWDAHFFGKYVLEESRKYHGFHRSRQSVTQVCPWFFENSSVLFV